MGVDPEEPGFWVNLLEAGYRADGLRVVTPENQGKETMSQGSFGRPFKS